MRNNNEHDADLLPCGVKWRDVDELLELRARPSGMPEPAR